MVWGEGSVFVFSMVLRNPRQIHSRHTRIYLRTVRRLDRTAKTSRSFLCPAAVLFHTLCWSRRKLAREREARVLLVEFIFKGAAELSFFFQAEERENFMAAPWSPQPEVSAEECCVADFYRGSHGRRRRSHPVFSNIRRRFFCTSCTPKSLLLQYVEAVGFLFSSSRHTAIPRKRATSEVPCISLVAPHPPPDRRGV